MKTGMQTCLYAVDDAEIGIFFRLHLPQRGIAFRPVFYSIFIMIHNDLTFPEGNPFEYMMILILD